MTGLEIRLIAYALLALAIVGGTAYAVHSLDSHHYEALQNAQKVAQDQALQAAQQRVIAAQNAQQAAEMTAESEHELRTQADTASRSAVLDSVRGLEAAVHSRLVPAAVANPAPVPAAQSGPTHPDAVASLLESVNASLDAFIAACQNTDSDRAAIISIAPKVTP